MSLGDGFSINMLNRGGLWVHLKGENHMASYIYEKLLVGARWAISPVLSINAYLENTSPLTLYGLQF